MKQLFTFLFLLSILGSCKKESSTTPVATTYNNGSGNVNLLLGNPSSADDNPSNTANYLLLKEQYVASYNSARGIPNWTAWHVDKNDLGTAQRQDDFRPDGTLPTGFYQVRPTDYTSADGFDRGHMCPSADRTSSVLNNSATFLMTNITPQAPELNRGLWEELEAFCREQVYAGNEVYIYSGGYGSGGQGSAGRFTSIAGGKVTVPARYFKIILILPNGSDDINRINENTTVLAVDVPNEQAVSVKNWDDYITTAATVEQASSLIFWTKLPDVVRTKLRVKKYTIAPVVSTPSTGTTTSPSTGTTTTPTTGTPTTPSTGTPATPSSCGYHNGKKLYKGPEGGCYYINSKGNKTYVNRSECTC